MIFIKKKISVASEYVKYTVGPEKRLNSVLGSFWDGWMASKKKYIEF